MTVEYTVTTPEVKELKEIDINYRLGVFFCYARNIVY